MAQYGQAATPSAIPLNPMYSSDAAMRAQFGPAAAGPQPPQGPPAATADDVATSEMTSAQWDFVIITPCIEEMKTRKCCGRVRHFDTTARARVEFELKAAGLETSTVLSRDRDEHFIRVRASQERLEVHAEHIKYPVPRALPREDPSMPLAWGPAEPYVSAATDAESNSTFKPFSSLMRAELIFNIIQSPDTHYPSGAHPFDAGAHLDLRTEIRRGSIVAAFPLHEPAARSKLFQTWVKRFWRPQPLNRVTKYFGSKVGMYFGFIGLYTAWLVAPAFLGIIVFALQQTITSASSIVTPIYSVFIMLWATFFLEFWKRRQNALAHRWGSLGFEEEEISRPTFAGIDQAGFYYNNTWVSLEDECIADANMVKLDKYSKQPIVINPYYSTQRRRAKMFASFSVSLVFIAVVCVVAIAILYMRIISVAEQWFGTSSFGSKIASIFGAAVNAIAIIALNFVYKRVARAMTAWENHRTQTEYEDALIIKSFLFQFINSYFTLFYIAFFKSKYPVCLGSLCRTGPCENGDCFTELYTQLTVIFLAKQIALQFMEIIFPVLIAKIKVKLEDRKVKKMIARGERPPKLPSQAELESKKNVYDSTFDDYNELVIQFGYVSLFVAASAVTPAIALLNNIIEIRIDAAKLLYFMQRPMLGKGEDIGSWYKILNALSVISVLTNCWVLAFTSSAFASANGMTITQRLWFAIITEHAVLIIKLFIAYLIPDVPGFVLKEIGKKRWLQERQMLRLKGELRDQLDMSRRRRLEEQRQIEALPQQDRTSNVDLAEEFTDEGFVQRQHRH